MVHVDLSKLAQGELQEKFDRELTKVVQNMEDPNTPYKDARSITIKISLSQTELRNDARTEISVSSKLSSPISIRTNFVLGKDLKTGEVMAREYGKQIPGQMDFSDMDPPEETQPEGKKITSIPRPLRANG